MKAKTWFGVSTLILVLATIVGTLTLAVQGNVYTGRISAGFSFLTFLSGFALLCTADIERE